MLVELSPDQMIKCQWQGRSRAEYYVQGHRKNMKDGLASDEILRYNVEGCMGELAVAIATGLKWTGQEGALRYDIDDRIEVRSTRYQNGKLIAKDREMDKCRPSTPYVLAIIQGSSVRVAGWRELDYLIEYGDCYEQKGIVYYAVRQNDLLPISDLR